MIQKIRDLDPTIHLLLFLCIVVLGVGFIFVSSELKKLKSNVNVSPGVAVAETKSAGCADECKSEISKIVSDAVATLAAVPKTIVKTVTPAQEERVNYIPLGGSFVTMGNDWVDVKSTDVWIDLKNEYGEDAYVDWEASIKSNSVSGKAFVRLFDVTHSIAVNGSELSTNSTSSSRVSSGRLYLWQGHNLYRVQLRSLAPYEATFESGKIKIVY